MKHRARKTSKARTKDRPAGRNDPPDGAPGPAPWSPRKDLLLLGGIFLLALVLRLAYLSQLRSSPLFEHPQMDARIHDEWARAIAGGDTYWEGPYFRAPLYPAVLAAVYKVFGPGYLAPRIVQSVLGALSCCLLYLLGRSLFGRAVGAVAGFAAATYWMLIYFDGELLIASLIVFLDLALLLLLVRAGQKPTLLRYGLAGILLGLSAIARPNILLFAPAVVVWILVQHRRVLPRAAGYVAGLTAGCLLVVLPITVRNHVVGGDAVLIASQGGVNFFIGNNEYSDGMTAIVPGTPADWWGGYHAAVERAEQARGRELKPSEVSDYYYGQAWAFMREQPGSALRLMVRKLGLFWSRREISNNKGIYFWTEEFTPLVRLLPLGFGLVGPLGVMGLALCWRRRLELFPLWGFVLVYMVSVVLFFCTARFRMPVLPPLILLGVYALFETVAGLRRRRWATVGVSGLALLAAAALIHGVPRAAQVRRDSIQSFVRLGSAYRDIGDVQRAEQSLRTVLETAPDYLSARYELGTLLARAGRHEEAIAELGRAATLPPRPDRYETQALLTKVHVNLGSALGEAGRDHEALWHYRAAMELDEAGVPPDIFLGVADVLRDLGQTEEADEAYLSAIQRFRGQLADDPGDPHLSWLLGQAYLHTGRYADSLEPLRVALEHELEAGAALEYLAYALVRVGQREEALNTLRGRLPGDEAEWTTRLAEVAVALAADASAEEAVEHYRAAIELGPAGGSAELRLELAAALGNAGRSRESKEVYGQAGQMLREALQSDPDNADLAWELGRALFGQERYGDAIEPLTMALARVEDRGRVLDYLSYALLRQGRYAESAALLREGASTDELRLIERLVMLLAAAPEETVRDGQAALDYAWNLCPVLKECPISRLDVMAMALAEVGRFEEAIRIATQGLERAQQSSRPSDKWFARQMAKRLEKYKKGQPYRLPRFARARATKAPLKP